MKLSSSLYRFIAVALLIGANLVACGKNNSPTVTSSTAPAVIFSHSLSIQGANLVSWGYNSYGQLGLRNNNNIDSRYLPVQVTGLPALTGVSAGGDHTLAFRNLTTVWAWGNNGFGQLGDNNTTATSYPVQVLVNPSMTVLSRVTAVAAGNNHSLALDENLTVWAWGGNYDGQLGDGTVNPRYLADKVKFLDAAGNPLPGVTHIAAGGEHSLALLSDGHVYAWGLNDNGQLGHNDTVNRTTPVQVYKDGLTTPLDNIVEIAAGGGHSLARENNGTLWAWGLNSRGQLGNGSTDRSLHAVPVVWPELAGHSVTQLSAGLSHSLALRDDGTVWGWGDNFFGQLGNGAGLQSETAVTTPQQVVITGVTPAPQPPPPPTPLTGITAIAAIGTHSLAFGGVSGTTVWAWGENTFGQLGDNTTLNRSTATQVTNLPLP